MMGYGMFVIGLIWLPVSMLCIAPLYRQLRGEYEDLVTVLGGIVQFFGGWVTLYFVGKSLIATCK